MRSTKLGIKGLRKIEDSVNSFHKVLNKLKEGIRECKKQKLTNDNSIHSIQEENNILNENMEKAEKFERNLIQIIKSEEVDQQ